MANLAAEKLLLSAFVRHPNTFFAFQSYVTEDDFMGMAHKFTFQAMRKLYIDKAVERLSKMKIISEAKELGCENFMSMTKDGKVLDEIFTEAPSEDEAAQHFQAVKKETIKRAYLDVTDQVRGYINTTTDPAIKMVDSIEQKLVDVSQQLNNNDAQIVNLGQDAESVIADLANNPGHLGWDLGFPVWQSKIGQVRNGSVTFVVGTAKSGKSQFGMRNALYVAHKHRAPVLLVDTELKKKDQIVRLVGMMAGVPYEILETGFWKLEDSKLVEMGLKPELITAIVEYRRRMNDPILWSKAKALPFSYLEASGMGVEEVIPKIRRWVMTVAKPDKRSKFPQCLTVYDYIKLATFDELRGGKIQEWQLHGLNMAAMHDFVNKWNIPMIALGQTNNYLGYDIKMVAGAKRIIDNVSSVSLLHRKDDDQKSMDGNGNYFIMPLVTRYGAGLHKGHINISFNPEIGEFNELGLSAIDYRDEQKKRLEEWKNENNKSKGKGKKKSDDDYDD
jgi:hypothetical protein